MLPINVKILLLKKTPRINNQIKTRKHDSLKWKKKKKSPLKTLLYHQTCSFSSSLKLREMLWAPAPTDQQEKKKKKRANKPENIQIWQSIHSLMLKNCLGQTGEKKLTLSFYFFMWCIHFKEKENIGDMKEDYKNVKWVIIYMFILFRYCSGKGVFEWSHI